ncbi:MAG: hypothetical protein WC917_00610 [Bacilli bacterium]|jgi:hypothetical protein
MIKKLQSLGDVIKRIKTKNKTLENNRRMFPVGTKVKVITIWQDFSYFIGNETGIVIKNHKNIRLGIIVKFDYPVEYTDGTTLNEFNFEPTDLIKI